MIKIKRTNSDDEDFQNLVIDLDADLKFRDGEEHNFYAEFNKIDRLKNVVVAYEDDMPVGCGAIKKYSEDAMEIKRMFVSLHKRGKGIATIVLKELENWSRELNYKQCILETGKKQPEAIQLYKRNNYKIIPNFGQYINVENSVCFAKDI